MLKITIDLKRNDTPDVLFLIEVKPLKYVIGNYLTFIGYLCKILPITVVCCQSAMFHNPLQGSVWIASFAATVTIAPRAIDDLLLRQFDLSSCLYELWY